MKLRNEIAAESSSEQKESDWWLKCRIEFPWKAQCRDTGVCYNLWEMTARKAGTFAGV